MDYWLVKFTVYRERERESQGLEEKGRKEEEKWDFRNGGMERKEAWKRERETKKKET